ncbi:MAG TPA: PhoU domain-containing protein [Acidimicrobiales bacterium]|nr:PhoU domain-containing protein [Acidimicrobiales bacterium]
MTESVRTAFDRELAALDGEVVVQAARVREALGATAEALTGGETGPAGAVLDGHGEIVAALNRCEARAYAALALQQPAAHDLRLLVTVIRLTHELERSAALARHVAAFAVRPRPVPPAVARLLGRMSQEAHQLFGAAVDAYVARDLAEAEALDVWDDRLDELHRQLLGELFGEPPDLATTLDVALVGRYLERVADHAVLIGHRLRYLVSGTL